jgi:hypothetical protein
MARKKNPVLQKYQVEVRGNQYYVINTKTHVTVGGPFKTRDAAQNRADQLERQSSG